MNLAFFTGAHGGDFLAVCNAIEKGLMDARIVALVASHENAPAFLRYRKDDPNAQWILRSFAAQERRRHFEETRAFLKEQSIDWVALAGFGFVLPPALVNEYPGRIINAHHSVLPAHPGLYRKEARVASSDRFLGATIHLVDAGVDTGSILYQAVFANSGMGDFEHILRCYRRAQDVMIIQCVRDITMGRKRGHSHNQLGGTLFSPAIDADIFEALGHD